MTDEIRRTRIRWHILLIPIIFAAVLAGCFGAAHVGMNPEDPFRAVLKDGFEGDDDNCTKCHFTWARRFEYYRGWDRYGYVFDDRSVVGAYDPWNRPELENQFEAYYATDWWETEDLYVWDDDIDTRAPDMSVLAGAGLPDIPRSLSDITDRALVVAPEGGEFRRIADAVKRARPGDTVFVRPGEYNETVVLKDGVSLVGEDPETTIINPRNTGHAIVAANASLISGLTLTGTGINYRTGVFNCAVYVSGCDSTCVIAGNIFRENGLFGVWIDGAPDESACMAQTSEHGTRSIELCDRPYTDYPNPIVCGNIFYRIGQRGVFCVHGRGEIFNNIFAGNVKALGLERHSRPLFHHNVCYYNNIPFACNRSEPVVWNNIFQKNQWGQRMLRGANPAIFGNVTWNSPFFRDFDEEGRPTPSATPPGTNERDLDPQFVDPLNGDFSFRASSPLAASSTGMDAVGIMRDHGLPQPPALMMANSWGREVLAINDEISALQKVVDDENAKIRRLEAAYSITYDSWLEIEPDAMGDPAVHSVSPAHEPVVHIEYDVPSFVLDGDRRSKSYSEQRTRDGVTTKDSGGIIHNGSYLKAVGGRFSELYSDAPDPLFIGERPYRETPGGFYRDFDQYVKGAIGPLGTFYNGYWRIMGAVIGEERVAVDGHECIVVRYPHIGKDQYFFFYLDPEAGYRPRKMEHYYNERLFRVIDGYEYATYPGGINLPMKVTVTDFGVAANLTGARIAQWTLTVDAGSVSVN